MGAERVGHAEARDGAREHGPLVKAAFEGVKRQATAEGELWSRYDHKQFSEWTPNIKCVHVADQLSNKTAGDGCGISSLGSRGQRKLQRNLYRKPKGTFKKRFGSRGIKASIIRKHLATKHCACEPPVLHVIRYSVWLWPPRVTLTATSVLWRATEKQCLSTNVLHLPQAHQ